MRSPLLRLLKSRWTWVAVLMAILVWHFGAYYRGALVATFDGVRGHDEIQTYGGPPSVQLVENRRLLKERYSVEPNVVGGCVMSDSLVNYVRGYNDVAEQRLNKKHGRDVFTECWAEAAEIEAEVVKKWQTEHPDWGKVR